MKLSTLKLRNPHSVLDAFLILLGLFGAISGAYGSWDITRFQVDVCHACGWYNLPFALGGNLPWYFVADGFLTMVFAGCAVFLLAFIDSETVVDPVETEA